MEKKMPIHLIERKLEKLSSITQISEQIEQIRKFLSHFISLLQSGPLYEEYYYCALNILENVIENCDVIDRDVNVLCKIMNTILEIVNRDYVSKRVVVESLAVISTIMGNLYHIEVIHLHSILQQKFPYVSKYFNEMGHYSIMWSIVSIIYRYVGKYDYDEREATLTDILQGFPDSTGQLADMLLWPEESFNSKCRIFLNSIPGRKYYSLAARSAIFGGKLILPRRGFDYISFNWNTDPFELSFNTFCFATEMNKASEVSVNLKDITTMQIIEDHNEPRVICEYEEITATGIRPSSDDSYELKIIVSDNDELNELAKFITPLIKSVHYEKLFTPPASGKMPQEDIIRHEKLYDNTVELVREINANEQSTKPEATLHTMLADQTTHDEETMADDPDENFKPFDMQWKFNFIDNSTSNKCLAKDPYDIAHMREEEKEQRKEKARLEGKSETQKKGANGKRPKNILSSTPKKLRPPKVTENLTIDKDDLSSIGENSHDESDGSDNTYEPYVMLSKTETRGRGNQKGRKRQSNPPARASAKRMNVKRNESTIKKSGTGRGTGTKKGKEQKWDAWSGTPTVEPSTHLDVAKKDGPCYRPDTPSRKPQTCNGSNQPGTKFRCERLNSINTTTKMTTKVTTTKTTEVGIGSCTETGNRPTADTTTQKDVTPPPEAMPGSATQKVYKSLYTVEKHQEYSIHCAVNETNCMGNALTEGERGHILAHVNKILEILSQGLNTTGMH